MVYGWQENLVIRKRLRELVASRRPSLPCGHLYLPMLKPQVRRLVIP